MANLFNSLDDVFTVFDHLFRPQNAHAFTHRYVSFHVLSDLYIQSEFGDSTQVAIITRKRVRNIPSLNNILQRPPLVKSPGTELYINYMH